MNIVSLLTDFGLKDGNVGVMKGVILGIAPRARIVDISHLISPQNVREAALILVRSAPYFPPDSVHVIVVDPGVGTERRPIAARVGRQYYVAPDNGVLTMVFQRGRKMGDSIEVVQLDRPRYWLSEISNVFHGRDIFAPSGAYLAAGTPLVSVGSRIDDAIELELPHPRNEPGVWQGEVIHIDHFGSLSTNIRIEHLGNPPGVTVRVGGAEIKGMVRTFGEKPPGTLVALYGSTGNLIISVVNGSAAERLGVGVGEPVEVYYTE